MKVTGEITITMTTEEAMVLAKLLDFVGGMPEDKDGNPSPRGILTSYHVGPEANRSYETYRKGLSRLLQDAGIQAHPDVFVTGFEGIGVVMTWNGHHQTNQAMPV